MSTVARAPEGNHHHAATVALKAYGRVADAWSLGAKDAARLAGLSESVWRRARDGNIASPLSEDQRQRLSALIGIYAALEIYFSEPLACIWFTRPNTGPLFLGESPLDVATERGRPGILEIRNYLEALLGGA